MLSDLHVNDAIREAGLMFDVGTAGKRLSQVQRQKLTLARALIKNPDVLIINRVLGGLDPRHPR